MHDVTLTGAGLARHVVGYIFGHEPKADDASPKDGGKQELHVDRILSELNRRGYYTLDCGLERLKEHQVGVELHPSHYAGTTYEGELASAHTKQRRYGVKGWNGKKPLSTQHLVCHAPRMHAISKPLSKRLLVTMRHQRLAQTQ